MAVCDICGTPGMGTVISSENMRQAVFGGGFDPFALGLAANIFGSDNAYKEWKRTVVAQDTSDWNICPPCMTKLRPFIPGTPRAAGIEHSTVSVSHSVGTLAEAIVEQKYKARSVQATLLRRQPKKWWQFWRK